MVDIEPTERGPSSEAEEGQAARSRAEPGTITMEGREALPAAVMRVVSAATSDEDAVGEPANVSAGQTPADAGPLADAALDIPLAEVQRYSIVREFARGGLGRILEVDDLTLGRKVAIKELKVPSERHRARLLREALITARLQHPSIVPLYDVGEWPTGELYYSMKLVSGRPLDVVIAEAKTLDRRLGLIPHVIAVADAMAYAHSQRIIHRDLKPANVLVGEFGETIVIDWGLAKDLEAAEAEADALYPEQLVEAPLTAAGTVVGTPVYMAPEQALGVQLDERADVYAIGAILYETITGSWPHGGVSSDQVIARLIAGEPIVPIEQLEREAPPELVTIVHKAMTLKREGRYPSAAELAADLRRFQTGQLVAAHHYSRTMLVRRWLRRHRAVLGVAGALLAVLAVTVAMSVRSIVSERNATRAERDRLILSQARGELERDPTATVAWLKIYPADGTEPAVARELAMEAHARGVARFVLPRAPAALGRFSSDGKLFAQPGTAGTRVIDLTTGAMVTMTESNTFQLAWAADGHHLAMMSEASRNVVTVMDVTSGGATTLSGPLATKWRPIGASLFDHAGDTLILPTAERGLRRYPRAGGGGEPLWTPFPLNQYIRAEDRFASVAPDGVMWWWRSSERAAHALELPAGVKLVGTADDQAFLDADSIVAGTTDGRLCVWSLPSGTPRVLDGEHAAFVEVVPAHGGKLVVTLTADNSLRVWQVATGESRAMPAFPAINDLGVTPDGRYAALALQDHTVVLVDLETGDHRRVGMHPAPVVTATVAPDGRWLATEGDDGTTRLWPMPGGIDEIVAHPSATISAVAMSIDGGTVITGGSNHRVNVWTGSRRRALEAHGDAVWVMALSHDGRTLVTGSRDQTIRLWDLASGQEQRAPLDARAGGVVSLELTRDDRRLVSGHAGGEVRVWDPSTGESRLLAKLAKLMSVALSRDDRLVAAGDANGALHVLPLDGTPGRTLPGQGAEVAVVRFAPDGRAVAGGGEDGRVIVWDLASGTRRDLGRLRGHVRVLEYSADGRWLVAGSTEGDVMLWDGSVQPGQRLDGHKGEVTGVSFALDSVVTAGLDGTVRRWTLTGELRALLRIDGQVTALVVTSDGRWLAAGTTTGVARRWSIAAFDDGPEAGSLTPYVDRLSQATLDPQSHSITPLR